MQLLFTPPPVAALSVRTAPCATRAAPKKPRAPPNFSRFRSAKCQWRPVDSSDTSLRDVAAALAVWNARTGEPPDFLPSDSHLRRCDVARELRLQSLIVRAGGYRAVQSHLGLRPRESSARIVQDRELAEMTAVLKDLLAAAGYPPPEDTFPEKRAIRKLSPHLGNRIAAFPGRNGYNRLAEYVKYKSRGLPIPEASQEVWPLAKKWRVWTDPNTIRTELLAYQLNPQVLPRLNSLPRELASAIQRKGGAFAFAHSQRMVLEKDWANMTRFATVVRWLADEVLQTEDILDNDALRSGRYMEIVRNQVINPPHFPTQEKVSKARMASELQRYGGRKGLPTRLGFDRTYGFKDVFMGPFSVQFAADILEFAVRQVDVCEGSVAMPTVETLKASGRLELAEATIFFEGEEIVGRRVGLVPQQRNRSQAPDDGFAMRSL